MQQRLGGSSCFLGSALRLATSRVAGPCPFRYHRRPAGGEKRRRRGRCLTTLPLSLMTLPTPAKKILLIEDDAKTARAVCACLESEGYATAWSPTGEDGFYRLNAEAFDAVLLDWMLPGRDGPEILQTLRARGTRTPVLLLTARDALEDRVLGLDSGADDYLVKPFAFPELLARVRALLRRTGEIAEQPPRRALADLTLDLDTRRVRRCGREIDLTAREFDLLAYLLSHRGTIVTREMLAREVWRELQRSTPLNNVIDVHIARLRRKIDEGAAVRLIHTVRGTGFVLREGVAEQ
jgi:two-component system copper resistance phosphate regulon response regulator CusR